MRIVIVDDDKVFSEDLKKQILTFFNKNELTPPEITIYEDGRSLLSDEDNIDFIFLDIEMPGMNGIQVAGELNRQDRQPLIFITTSYPEYLDDAMRVHVFRYLSKPLETKRLYRNLKDALLVYHASSTEKILVETKEGCYSCCLSDIVCVEVQGRTIILYTTKEKFTTRQTFHYWTETLTAPCFFKTHQSYIVNMKYVTNFDHLNINLCNGAYHAFLTRRKYRDFKDAYLMYLKTIN